MEAAGEVPVLSKGAEFIERSKFSPYSTFCNVVWVKAKDQRWDAVQVGNP